MPVDSNLLGNTNNTFQNTSNTKVLNKGCDALQGSALQGSALQGGGGYSNTFKTLEQNSNDNMGRGYGSTENYSHCNKQGGGGAEKLGSASHATNRFNHSFSGGYGYGKEGAAVAHELKGSYAAMTQNNDMNSCSGGRKHKRKSLKRKSKKKCNCKGKCKCKTKRKSRKRKPKRKSRKRKPKRKSRGRKSRGRKSRGRKSRGRKLRGRKSRGRKSRRRRSRKTIQKGGGGGMCELLTIFTAAFAILTFKTDYKNEQIQGMLEQVSRAPKCTILTRSALDTTKDYNLQDTVIQEATNIVSDTSKKPDEKLEDLTKYATEFLNEEEVKKIRKAVTAEKTNQNLEVASDFALGWMISEAIISLFSNTVEGGSNQKGGSSISYSSIDSNLTGNDARILGTNAFLSSNKNCGDGYNHYTGGNEKTIY